MSGASKILTVSYGTFSCTLEGFEDPFTTMRHIAEYFRGLAAEDRYFGCEPPVPDTETLQQIAQGSIRRRVAAEMQQGGIVLRQSDEDVTEAPVRGATVDADTVVHPARISVLPAGMPSASEKLDRIRRAANGAQDDTGHMAITRLFETEDEPAAETGEEPVLPAFSEESSPELTGAAPEAPDDQAARPEPVAMTEEPEADGPEVAEASEDAPDALAAAEATQAPLEETGATVAGTVEEPETVSEHEAAESVGESVAEELADARPETEADDAATSGQEAADDTVGLAAAESAQTVSTLTQVRARLARFARREPASPAETAAQTPAEAPEPRIPDVAEAAAPEAVDVVDLPQSAEADAGPAGETQTELSASPAEPESPVEAEPMALPTGEAAQAAEAEPVEEESSLSSEEEAELQAELASLSDAETDFGTEDEVDEAALAVALDTSSPYVPETYVPETPEVGEHPEAQAEAPVTLPEAEQETAAGTDMPQDAVASGPVGHEPLADPFEPVDEAQEDRALSRLLETADSKLSGTETTRKRNAFQQLKAAVAATFADRQARKETPGIAAETDERSAVYRSDLRRATRPTRPPMPERTGERTGDRRPPAPSAARPAPLVLVSEQRIDERRAQSDRNDGTIRPRRVLRETEDLGESVRMATQAPEDDDSFRDFAERIGANSLSELLEAAAAYTAHVEGRTRFSRAQVMSKLAMIKADDSDGFSREDGLRSFGKLLREGRIRRVQDGQFVINEESRFVQEARTGTQ